MATAKKLTLSLSEIRTVAHGNFVECKSWKLKCRDCTLGEKSVRGGMAIGKVERESIWSYTGGLLEFLSIFPG